MLGTDLSRYWYSWTLIPDQTMNSDRIPHSQPYPSFVPKVSVVALPYMV
ncbi:MAG: hypothetical protein RIE73_24500 [Coleofasciculus sp. C1-SOL-03]